MGILPGRGVQSQPPADDIGQKGGGIGDGQIDPVSPEAFAARLNPNLPEGLAVLSVEALPPGRQVPQPDQEFFELTVPAACAASCLQKWRDLDASRTLPVVWTSKKGERRIDAWPLLTSVAVEEPATVRFVCRFDEAYVSPLRLVEAVCPEMGRGDYALVKTGATFAQGDPSLQKPHEPTVSTIPVENP